MTSDKLGHALRLWFKDNADTSDDAVAACIAFIHAKLVSAANTPEEVDAFFAREGRNYREMLAMLGGKSTVK